MKKYLFGLLLAPISLVAQQLTPLTIEKIMNDPKWMGTSPSGYRWSADSKNLFFSWNPEAKEKNAIYKIAVHQPTPQLSEEKEQEEAVGLPKVYTKDRRWSAYEKGGDVFLENEKSGQIRQLTQTVERESSPRFLTSNELVFQRGENLFAVTLNGGEVRQLSNFIRGKRQEGGARTQTSAQDSWLKADQEELFDIVKKRNKQGNIPLMNPRNAALARNTAPGRGLRPVYLEDKILSNVILSPNGRFLTYRITTPVTTNHYIVVPNYVTSSGYTENIPGRTKVGEKLTTSETFIQDLERDTIYKVNVSEIPGIKDLPDYLADYPQQLEERKQKNEDREVNIWGPLWNEEGKYAILIATAHDNKDLWILNLDQETGSVALIDRQRDEAWIGGPGIGMRGAGWIDDQRFYFQSEVSGYSHLYLFDTHTKQKKALTSGKWEVQRVQLSKDKSTFYISANKEHPGITHFYRMSVNGGEMTRLTGMKGGNEVTLSPDEKWLAIHHSYMNRPWELYIQPNKPGAQAVKVTKSTSALFDSYPWMEPDMVSFKNRHGDEVYARVYPAKNPHPNKPAVVFVHGAGYLQNVHFWWSQYFREYMFNNMLSDQGYTVIDIDFTASSGYGRNHRTGIYRHMGGKDLTDQVDGVKMLVEKYGVNPVNVGIYGGSYGGFITLMALFKEPESFAAGAALRSVTDWAHYNHGYTSNILNEPVNDPKAYKQSSPIYFADQLKGHLLMAHGMVDVNVHFQDIVRISQRFIELGKDNWELAVYPVEDHAFVEASSWTDEYKRIYKLFEQVLKKDQPR